MTPARLWGPLVVAALLAPLARAAGVVETAPADIASALSRETVSVVLFTSPDPTCGYCVGEDKAFEAFARQQGGDKVAYRRVQWSPWRAMPAMDIGARVRAIPMTFVFRGRQAVAVLKGRLGNESAWLKFQVERALSDGRMPVFGSERPGADTKPPTVDAPSPADREAVRLAVYSGLFEQATTLCADLNVGLESRLTDALAQWRARRKPPAPPQVRPATERLGGVETNRLVLEIDRSLAGQLSPNDAGEAGCTGLVELIRKS